MTNTRERMSIHGYTSVISDYSRRVFHRIGDINDETTLDGVIDLLDGCYDSMKKVLEYLDMAVADYAEDED